MPLCGLSNLVSIASGISNVPSLTTCSTFLDRALHLSATAKCAQDPMCISVGKIPLLKHQRIGLIDPDTPKSALVKKAFSGRKMKLVVSVR